MCGSELIEKLFMSEKRISEFEPVLNITDLSAAYQIGDELLEAVRDISLTIHQGQTYGLVGESGSGKTTLAMAVMQYLGKGGVITQGSIELNGVNLLNLDQSEIRKIWGSEISLVPQNPLSSLNPSIRIGKQISEILSYHRGLNSSTTDKKAIELLEKVHIPDPQRVAESYPHQISGGMRQRVLIAMAISLKPGLLILDEPTTSLDVTTEASILDLIQELMREGNSSALYVTHNLGVVAQICDRVTVMYAGELLEDAAIEEIFERPLHPYTIGLLGSVPKPGSSKKEVELSTIGGQIPALGARPDGCIFAPRCPLAIQICSERPSFTVSGSAHSVRCHRWEEINSGSLDTKELFERQISKKIQKDIPGVPADTLNVENLEVHFKLPRSMKEVFTRQIPENVKAVDGISMTIERGKTIGLVGESGSGKTTIARAIVGLQPPTDGEVELLDLPLPPQLSKRDITTLRQLQMVFQNPEEALNPYMSVGSSLRRPLMRLLSTNRREADNEAARLLEAVQLSSDYADRMPHQLSGGEKQRVAIARAFASNPDLLLADEPVSSLDVSVQASILNLLNELQINHESSTLFISHDLAVVSYIADIVAVIYLGKFMEITHSEDLFRPPYHPYTEALLSSIPLPDPKNKKERIRLEGDIPSPVNIPSGCRFHTRCPRFIGEVCVKEEPTMQTDQKGNKFYCHIPFEALEQMQSERNS